METVEEIVEVDRLYLLFLFLGIHLLKLYWEEGRVAVGNRRKWKRGEVERNWFGRLVRSWIMAVKSHFWSVFRNETARYTIKPTTTKTAQ